MIRTFLASAALLVCVPAAAQDRDPLPASQDAPYPGTIRLHVDASDTRARAFRTVQQIPVVPGAQELVLVYPMWLPGNHAASGQVQRISRLAFTSDAGPVSWERVPYAPSAFRLALPAGATQVTAELTYASPFPGGGWRTLITEAMANVQWEKMSLYPAGYDVARIPVEASVTLPEGWQAAGALDGCLLYTSPSPRD